MMDKQKAYYIYCPNCGREVQRSVTAETETKCSKCKHDLVILVEKGIVTVIDSNKGETSISRDYLNRLQAYAK